MVALILLAITIIGFLIVIDRRDERAREERRDLENQLLALSRPVALTTVESVRNRAEGHVSYMDDEREAELMER